jgi:hypothetical protein
VEDNIINETNGTNGRGRVFNRRKKVESVIENGVKITSSLQSREYTGDIDEALQKGVKRTIWANYADPNQIDEVVDGIEETNWANHADPDRIDEVIEGGDIINGEMKIQPRQDAVRKLEKIFINNIIQNNIKETSHRQFLKTYDVKDTIQDGTEHDYWVLDGCDTPVDKVIENGIKETNYDTSQYIEDVNEVIENGIEEIYEVDWDVPNCVIDDVVDNGVKNSNPLQYMPKEIINNVVENGITSTHDDIYHHRGRVDGVIKNGIKETYREICEYKETVEYIIQTGIKETEPQDDWINTVRIVDEVIDEGEKISGTFAGGKRQKENIESVIGYGIKKPTD